MAEYKLFLYPDPASNKVTIDLKNCPGNPICIEISDLKGIRMHEVMTNEREAIVNIEKYKSGVYFVKVRTAASNHIGKFLKIEK
jgi:hypothetical protein